VNIGQNALRLILHLTGCRISLKRQLRQGRFRGMTQICSHLRTVSTLVAKSKAERLSPGKLFSGPN
jgi:hypothetical protein